jgi:nitrate reductase gamma subunit
MTLIQIFSLIVAGFCIVFFLVLLINLLHLGKPKEYSQRSGNVSKSVLYANTAAMMPNHKESAMLHLPTFLGGIVFHIGIFTSFLLFFCTFFTNFFSFLHHFYWIHGILIMIFIVTACTGTVLFIKRIMNKELRELSNIDDYLSNGFTTLFQWNSIFYLFHIHSVSFYYLYYGAAILLFVYMPIGKLKHPLYYFFARFNLGFFYGWRNSWPPARKKHKE